MNIQLKKFLALIFLMQIIIPMQQEELGFIKDAMENAQACIDEQEFKGLPKKKLEEIEEAKKFISFMIPISKLKAPQSELAKEVACKFKGLSHIQVNCLLYDFFYRLTEENEDILFQNTDKAKKYKYILELFAWFMSDNESCKYLFKYLFNIDPGNFCVYAEIYFFKKKLWSQTDFSESDLLIIEILDCYGEDGEVFYNLFFEDESSKGNETKKKMSGAFLKILIEIQTAENIHPKDLLKCNPSALGRILKYDTILHLLPQIIYYRKFCRYILNIWNIKYPVSKNNNALHLRYILKYIYRIILWKGYNQEECEKMNLYNLIGFDYRPKKSIFFKRQYLIGPNYRPKQPIKNNINRTTEGIQERFKKRLEFCYLEKMGTTKYRERFCCIRVFFRLFNLYSRKNRNYRKTSLESLLHKDIHLLITLLFNRRPCFKKEYLKALTNMGDKQLKQISPQARALLSDPNCSLINKFIQNNPVKYSILIGASNK